MKSKIFLAGFPGTGKTTFLAAFWHIIKTYTNTIDFKLEKLSGNVEYLNSIEKTWLGCIDQPRTTGNKPHEINLYLFDNKTNKNIELDIPDISGELFDSLFEHRKYPKKFRDLIQSSNGVMLYLNSDQTIIPIQITEFNNISSNSNIPQSKSVQNKGDNPEEMITWESSQASTQIKNVELLQCICNERNNKFPLRVAIMISAWDFAEKFEDKISPEAYLKKLMPLFYQFLITHSNILDINYFGISAQGGDFITDKNKLLEMDNQANRVFVVFNKSKSRDLILPIKWIIS